MTFRTRAALMAISLVAFAAWLSFQPGGVGPARVVSDLGLLAGSLVAAWACLRRARHGGASRRAWLLTGLSALLWSAAQTSWSFSQHVLGQELPYPSFADALYLGAAAIGIAALFAFPSAPRGLADRARMLLDGLVIAASLLFIAWDAVLAPLLDSSPPGLPSHPGLALAYPLSGIARTSILLVVLARAQRGRTALNLLAGGLVAHTLTDGMFAYLLSDGTYRTGGPLDAGWLVAYLLIALAASSPGAGEDGSRTAGAAIAVPYLPMVVAGAILWVGLTADHLHGALLWIGSAVFALVAVRQALTHLENGSLTGALEGRISAAEASETELRRRGQQLDEAQHLARLGSWEIVLGSDRVEVSAGLYDVFGVEPGSFEPTRGNFDELVHPEDRAMLHAVLTGAEENGETGSAESRFRLENGRSVCVDTRVEAVRSADGTIVGLRGTSQDVSDRRASEEALRTSEERLRNIVDASPLAIIEFDAAKIVRVWNPAAEALYHWAREEVEGRVAPFARTDSEGAFDLLFGRALAGEHILNEEVVRRRKDEQTVYVSVSMAPIRDDEGDIIGVASAGLDISHQRRLEGELRAAHKMEAIGRLAGGVAHDFNNLLTVVVAYGELLLDELDPESRVGRRIGAMYEAASRAAGLTDQLLTFSRRRVVTGEPADLDETVGSLGLVLERLVGDDIELQIRLSGAALSVAADRRQLEEVLLNLAVNACDAMPQGGSLTITTTSVVGLSGPTTAVLRVADTGSGMDESTRDQIFEPFFSTKAEHVGTGLGLSAVYGIVRQHGGNVDVSSVPGAGSVFTVSLPLLPSPPSADPVRNADAGIHTATARVGTVLLVEDESSVRLLAREILELHGHAVVEAADGPEALAVAATHDGRIDVLLTDVVLPSMAGPVVAERLVADHPDLQVVFVSGYAENHLAGVDLAGRRFLAKPFRPADLAAAVAAALACSGCPQDPGSKR